MKNRRFVAVNADALPVFLSAERFKELFFSVLAVSRSKRKFDDIEIGAGIDDGSLQILRPDRRWIMSSSSAVRLRTCSFELTVA